MFSVISLMKFLKVYDESLFILENFSNAGSSKVPSTQNNAAPSHLYFTFSLSQRKSKHCISSNNETMNLIYVSLRILKLSSEGKVLNDF